MPNTMRQPFVPRGEYIAKRSFVCNGHKFSLGDDFPWRRLSIDNRKLHSLWDNNFIMPKEQLDEPIVEEIIETSEADPIEDTEEVVDEIEDVEEGFTFDPEIHTLDHPGSNQWLIKRGEEVVLRVNRKEWKRLDGKTDPTKVKMDRVVSED